ncbi:MAG: BON domain-containing protein [Gammaproteobacteria bacterium]|nr:BON domain-containing protein [Gammaproteobacteria bacterium]
MKINKLLAGIFIISSVGLLSACTNTSKYDKNNAENDQKNGEVMTDVGITAKVKSALLAEKDVNSFDISVTTFNGNVQLAGFVDSKWQIDKAVQVAKNVKGVKDVKSDLIHKPVTK